MRIPEDHFLTLEYVKKFGLENDLLPFEQENKLSGGFWVDLDVREIQ
jgi:hypothetical protein